MKAIKIFSVATVLGLVALSLSCGATKPPPTLTAEDMFNKAKRRYDTRHYLEAAGQFKEMLVRHPGSKFAEPANFLLGKCNYETKEYPLAEVEFGRVVRDFPRGRYAEEAHFMLGMCAFKQRRPVHYDQTATQEAIVLFGTYLARYPGGAFSGEAGARIRECRSILAEKLFLNGTLYVKLRRWQAARLCFEELLEKYSDLQRADWAQVGLGRCYEEEKDWERAEALYGMALEKKGDAELVSAARDGMKRVQSKKSRSVNSG
ncbi:MAG: outer membrane protein assembly factor BamD [Candidatus Eisenbacteria bacterium]